MADSDPLVLREIEASDYDRGFFELLQSLTEAEKVLDF